MKNKKRIVLVLALAMVITTIFTGCGSKIEADGNTLVYGSGDYTAINPALYEHGEINLLLLIPYILVLVGGIYFILRSSTKKANA